MEDPRPDEQVNVELVLASIDRDRLTRTLTDLIAQPSINPFGADPGAHEGEGAMADYLGQRLSSLGWSCETQEYAPGRCNVVARLAGRSDPATRPIMLAGHMDTVETDGYSAPFVGVVRSGRVHGRGACDMKAALACYVEVAEVLAAAGVLLSGDLLVAGVADEEYRQQGAKELGRAPLDLAGVIIGEPTELRVCAATKGLAAYDIVVAGSATHSSVPQHGSNAILDAADLLVDLREFEKGLAGRGHPLLGQPTMNVGMIDGGLRPNIVPAQCRIRLSRRLLPGETADGARDEFVRFLERRVTGHWSMSDAWWSVDPYELALDHPLVRTVCAAAATAGQSPAPTGFPASSDAAYFGAPAVLVGPGSLAQAHSLDEWVSIDQMVTCTEIYLRTVLGALAPVAEPAP